MLGVYLEPVMKLIGSELGGLAQIDRDLIVERTQARLARARAEGVRRRSSKTSDNHCSAIRLRLSRASIIAIRDVA